MIAADGGHERTPNRAQLREIASLLVPEPWIESVAVFPANRPESILLDLVIEQYPHEVVSAVYVEIQSYTNGEFHITYVETHDGERWVARWDRHESPDYDRDHFHAPPAARHEDGANRVYPTGLVDVIAGVVAPWIYERIGDMWDETERPD